MIIFLFTANSCNDAKTCNECLVLDPQCGWCEQGVSSITLLLKIIFVVNSPFFSPFICYCIHEVKQNMYGTCITDINYGLNMELLILPKCYCNIAAIKTATFDIKLIKYVGTNSLEANIKCFSIRYCIFDLLWRLLSNVPK